MPSNSCNRQRVSLVAGLVVACAVSGAAQTKQPGSSNVSPGGASISGRVVLPDGNSLGQSTKIRLETFRGVSSSAYTDSEGRFQFNELSPGSYQVVIDGDKERFETTSQRVEVLRGLPVMLTITLKEKGAGETTKRAASAVSAGELDSAVPSKAKKEFDRATHAGEAGKPEEAIAHLRNAIAIYPQYLMAHNDLGALLLESGKLDEAEVELRAALVIDRSAFNPTLNLGMVLVQEHQFSEARELLQKAVSLKPESPAARLYRGLALLGTSDLDGAEAELKSAYKLGGGQYAQALFHLGQLYMDKGDRALARQYFERYIQEAPGAKNLDQVRSLIASLN